VGPIRAFRSVSIARLWRDGYRGPAPGDEHPVWRLGMPADVAVAALFLASEESSWTTGVILAVAGGSVMVQVSGE
jgi:NAD(P)-dependent dehydrogenase (short-subunit alcohol dehydrogenase family)